MMYFSMTVRRVLHLLNVFNSSMKKELDLSQNKRVKRHI